MKVGYCDVQYSTVAPLATALWILSNLRESAVSAQLKAASETRMSRPVPRLGRGSSLWIHYLFLLWKTARFFNALLLWTRQTEGRRRKSILRWASGNESARLHSFAFLSASHSASHFLTLRCAFLLSVSLELCSCSALTLILSLKHTTISLYASSLSPMLLFPAFFPPYSLSPSRPLLCVWWQQACGSGLPWPTLIHAS